MINFCGLGFRKNEKYWSGGCCQAKVSISIFFSPFLPLPSMNSHLQKVCYCAPHALRSKTEDRKSRNRTLPLAACWDALQSNGKILEVESRPRVGSRAIDGRHTDGPLQLQKWSSSSLAHNFCNFATKLLHLWKFFPPLLKPPQAI